MKTRECPCCKQVVRITGEGRLAMHATPDRQLCAAELAESPNRPGKLLGLPVTFSGDVDLLDLEA